MHYFRVEQPGVVTNTGAILVTFWNHGYWYIAYRHKQGYAQITVHQNGGNVGEPSFYGIELGVTEAEALATDPALFQEAFADYEKYKVWEQEQLLLQQKRQQHTPKKGQRHVSDTP